LKNWKVLDLAFFVSDIITGIDLHILGRGQRALWAPTPRANFLT